MADVGVAPVHDARRRWLVVVFVGGDRRADLALAAPRPFSERLGLLVWAYLHEEDSCREAVADRAVKATNGAMWRELDRHWSTHACAHLDRLASRLEASDPIPGPVGLHVEALAEEIGVPSWEALHVGWMAAAASADPVRDRAGAAATVIRAFGLAACVEHDLAARCPCLLRDSSSARAPERARGGSQPDIAPASQSPPGTSNDRESGDDAQVFFDVLVEAVLKGMREATTSLAWEVLNEAVARQLGAEWNGSIIAALNGVASALDALREGLQDGARTVAGAVIGRSGLPPWARDLAARLTASLVGLPVNTQLHIAALSIRLFGACLEIELAALGRAITANEVINDQRVRPVLEDLWDHLEPLHVKTGVIHLLVRFDYGQELTGVLEALRIPAPRIELAQSAAVGTARSSSGGGRFARPLRMR